MRPVTQTAALLLTTMACHGLDLYVSPRGNDSADGRSEKTAFASLLRARDAIRHFRNSGKWPAEGISVELTEGRHVLRETLALGPMDSGSPGAPVVWRAHRGSSVEIQGGRVLTNKDLKPVDDPAMRGRLDESARDRIRCASVRDLGLNHAGPFPEVFSDHGGIFELFWNGQRLPLSRWPNEGWATMKSALVNGDKNVPGVFEYRDDRPSRWLRNSNIWLKGQWRVAWEDPAIRVAAIDPSKSTITFAKGIQLGIGNKYTRPKGNGKEPWRAVNLPEEIDMPGEWAIDFASGILYVWPPDGAGELAVSQVTGPLVRGEGVSHIRFERLAFNTSLGDGVVLTNAASDTIAGCVFKNLAGWGVVIDGTRNTVLGCDMSELGAGCVMISGGDHRKLVSSGNEVINNHLHHYGRRKAMYSAAVDVGFGGASNAVNHKVAVGVRVANNLIHDGPRDAILVSGQDHVFERNEIFRCGFESDDLGAFYSWLDWTIRGVVIRHNYIHDTVGGVNPDDGASGFIITGNIFAGPRTGVWIASGPDHTISHNIFIKAEGPVFGVDDRGVSRGYAKNPKLIRAVEEIRPAENPWAQRFPEMVHLLENRPELPQRVKFNDNLVVIQKGDAVNNKMSKVGKAVPGLLDVSGNWVTAQDPGFTDVANGDLTLRPDAEVFRRIPGFQQIPFREIGLIRDEFRTKLPEDAAIRRPKNNPMIQKDEEKHFGT